MRFFVPLVMLIICKFAVADKTNDQLDIYWIDVEGGGATLMVTPQNETILIDTGNPGLRDANRIVKVLTEVAGQTQIDHLIVTHYHRDHYGGAEMLSTLVSIGHVWDNGKFDGMPDNPGQAYFNFRCKQRHVLQPGDVVPLKVDSSHQQPLQLQCLVARKEFVSPEKVNARPNPGVEKLHKPKERDGSDNANSIVMLLKFGDFEFFDAGDLTWNQELKLVSPFNLVGEVDVYQVTHHGLDSSNNPIVLTSLKPKVAIMNNGHEKGCLPEVFANLSTTDSIESIYQLHKNLRPDGDVNNTQSERIANHHSPDECNGNYVHLSVAADSQSYTVHIPATKHQQTFATK